MNEYFEVVIGKSSLLDKDAKTQPEHNDNTVFESYDEAFEALCAYYKRMYSDKPERVKQRLQAGSCTINQLSFDEPEEEDQQPIPQEMDEEEQEVVEEEAEEEQEEDGKKKKKKEKKKK